MKATINISEAELKDMVVEYWVSNDDMPGNLDVKDITFRVNETQAGKVIICQVEVAL